jgi:hypothetical protein
MICYHGIELWLLLTWHFAEYTHIIVLICKNSNKYLELNPKQHHKKVFIKLNLKLCEQITNLGCHLSLIWIRYTSQQTLLFICFWLRQVYHNSWRPQKERLLKTTFPKLNIINVINGLGINIRCVLPNAAWGWYSGSLGSGEYPDCAKKTWAYRLPLCFKACRKNM